MQSSLSSSHSIKKSHFGFKVHEEFGLPEAQLLPLIPYSFSLPDFVIQIDDEVIHELSFRLGSEMPFRNLQDLSKLLPC